MIIVPSDRAPDIRGVLQILIGEDDSKDIEIIANDVVIHPEGEGGRP